MDKIALIVGASGIIGSNLAHELIATGWTTYGLARRPQTDMPGLHPVAADLLDPASLEKALADVNPTHVFLTSWLRNDTGNRLGVVATSSTLLVQRPVSRSNTEATKRMRPGAMRFTVRKATIATGFSSPIRTSSMSCRYELTCRALA